MHVLNRKPLAAMLVAFSLCMAFALATAPLASAQDDPDASSTPPTTPTGLTANAVSSSEIDLSWDASTDAVGVTGYDVYLNGTQIGTSPSPSYADTGLFPSTSYTYTVDAYDAAGNVSSQSVSATATTLAPPSDTTDDTSDATTTDPSVTTGDASSDSETNNDVNDNTTDSDAASTTVDDTNDASTTNDTDSTAATGDNTADTTDGDASVSTGDAISQANVINVVNTNITNSQGLIAFINALGGAGYDLSDLFGSAFSTTTDESCSLSSCDNGDTSLTVDNDNDATVSNTVLSVASTGDNDADTTDGDASISTGDAAASANVVNAVNTNITDSNYLLVALNNFGDLDGNIVLPSASFFDQLMDEDTDTGSTTVSNDNTATVNSTTTADADTGDNTASSTDDSDVSTGDALSNATTVNDVNTNDTGGTTVYMLINVFGDWTGDIQGLPAGLTWTQTPDGILITGDSDDLSTLASGDTGSTDVSNTNTATVNNNVQVYALTGDNEAADASGTADIATGDAYASANVVNLINTNILGQNWILLILNIFGNWDGDLDFGQPNLWIGAEAQTTNPTQPGSQVVYTFTVANSGDADADNVVLTTQYDTSMLTFDSGTATSSGVYWDLGTIPAGQTEQFSYTATAGDPPSGQVVAVPLTATISTDTDEASSSVNTDEVAIAIGDQFPTISGFSIGQYQDDPQLTITKSESIDQTTVPATVNYTVNVSDPDNAGPAYDAVLSDTLTGPNGNMLYNNSWDLDTVNPGDDITLTYSIQYAASSTPGAYLDTSEVTGYQNYTELPYANVMPLVSAVSALTIQPTGQVLGASTSTVSSCTPLLTSYIIQGAANNTGSVSTLQWFLNTFENAALTVTGVYDAPTVAAVKAFQEKYASDILAPWGMTEPSGNVYYTTENEINNINCGDDQFSLTPPQLEEIQQFKTIGTGTYGVAKTQKHFAVKPKAKNAPQIAQALPMPIVVTPPPPSADSLLNHMWKDMSSAFGVSFAQAESRN